MSTQITVSLPPTQYLSATPTTGQTVFFNDNGQDQVLYINPAGPLLTLTITVPSNSNSRLGQRIYFCISQAITTLTFGGGSILNTINTVTGNELVCFVKVADNLWAQQLSI